MFAIPAHMMYDMLLERDFFLRIQRRAVVRGPILVQCSVPALHVELSRLVYAYWSQPNSPNLEELVREDPSAPVKSQVRSYDEERFWSASCS